MKALCFFEDEAADNFQPLTLTRPTADLRIGIMTIAEKWCRSMDIPYFRYAVKNYLIPLFKGNYPSDVDVEIWINSRYLPGERLVNAIKRLNINEGMAINGQVIAAKVNADPNERFRDLEKIRPRLTLQNSKRISVSSINRLWDILAINGSELVRDLNQLKQDFNWVDALPAHVIATQPEQLYIHPSATIEPGVIFVTDGGPIYVGKNVEIMAGSTLRGPLAICDHAKIKMGAKIYKNTTIGPYCKIGGEVKHCIFHSYSNKGHEGFTGNSIIGQWCNMGADTNTSNLKNNYSLLRLTDFKTRQQIQTDQQFIGTIMGDHCKTSINTMLNTGTLIGVSSNIFCSGFPPKCVSSFRWLGDTNQTYILDKAIDTMQKVMGRRDCSLTPEYKKMMETIFEQEMERLENL